ncbi:MAG: hypothetical protein Q4B71_05030 [Cardiobacteriaceae bacterium]|nr:hypothetical protein [Cardiobacteriaceae bacterium]
MQPSLSSITLRSTPKALWLFCLFGLSGCQPSQTYSEPLDETYLVPKVLSGETTQFTQKQCHFGETFESRYTDETKQKLLLRYRGQEMMLYHHVHQDLVIYEGDSIALYSDGHIHQLAHNQTGKILANSCQ